nr:thermonuclease family protein [uncultured Cohaesibacter sp.]
MHKSSSALAISLFLLTSHAYAEEKHATASVCTESARAVALGGPVSYTPPLTIKQLEQGGFTLKGLVPDYFPTPELKRQKQKEISRFVSKAPLKAYVIGHRKPDRYARHDAFLARSENGKEILLQDILVSKGLARVLTDGLQNDCVQHLLSLETTARKAQTGLWKETVYSVKNTDDLHLSAIVSTYQIVSGIVSSVHRKIDGTSYLNFGDNWYEDFTISLSKKQLQNWEARNKFLDDLQNKPIYVRGWVEDSGGPLIELHEASQLIEADNNESYSNAH